MPELDREKIVEELKQPGYYWAKWKIASPGTFEADEQVPSQFWEIVQVWVNSTDPNSDERFGVSVPGVRETQWPDQFYWGPMVAEYNPKSVDDYVAWCKYTHRGEIVTCDSDEPKAFRVYRHPSAIRSLPQPALSEHEQELAACFQKFIDRVRKSVDERHPMMLSELAAAVIDADDDFAAWQARDKGAARMTTEELDRIVRHLHDIGAVHRKGFKLNEVSTDTMFAHLVDELVELRKANTHRECLDEAGDVVGVLLHLLYAMGLPLPDVIEAAAVKLDRRFAMSAPTLEALAEEVKREQ